MRLQVGVSTAPTAVFSGDEDSNSIAFRTAMLPKSHVATQPGISLKIKVVNSELRLKLLENYA